MLVLQVVEITPCLYLLIATSTTNRVLPLNLLIIPYQRHFIIINLCQPLAVSSPTLRVMAAYLCMMSYAALCQAVLLIIDNFRAKFNYLWYFRVEKPGSTFHSDHLYTLEKRNLYRASVTLFKFYGHLSLAALLLITFENITSFATTPCNTISLSPDFHFKLSP